MPAHDRLDHLRLALRLLPGLATSARWRHSLSQMRAFSRRLPAVMDAPLPAAMGQITPAAPDPPQARLPEADLRQLADLAALLDRGSPLGLCLRRSLVRYHFLRRAGLPLVVQFGAKFLPNQFDAAQHKPAARQLTGHAWVTLDGRPYHESDENWRDFTVMLVWPERHE